ncbi:TlpA disulfide reductase family protein [Cyclobacterium xiamenense]|uniref:TlpA disulfide reductase family protein n=1 Tax=Cyclobacterium xiamenense TaxID=1297121 RepID=UPI0012B6EA11|nr:TlpA disulfide reductase family protein [Cyclobacterium xiamenense]
MRKLMQQALVLGLTGALLVSCGNKEEVFDGAVSIKGQLANQPEGQVVLSRYDNDRIQAVDTLSVDNDGEFSYELELDSPNFYELDLFGEKTVRLALYEEDVLVSYDFKTDELDVSGSKDSELMLSIDELTAAYQEAGNELNSEFYEAMADKDQAKIQQIQEQAMDLELDHAEKIKGVIAQSDGSFAALAGLGMLNPRTDFNYLDSVIVALGDQYPDMKLIASWKQELDELRALSIGQPAPEISLPNPEGEMVNLSDLRGNYVLVDFWAGWCKPCRDENPNVVRLYNQYKDRGFEVFGVSLDRTRDMWLRAIEEDGLEWTQVSDLKYFNSEAAATYQINAIPATYMIDPEGNILAKDLRGRSLERKLQELFD